ncbi:uncharacterized protein LOC126555885 isoform X2 [Aphis gossypii]|uniref:uncharacterized protein LOC126555885 isoform X2 n=1 Tax=Aphis gossypii TaxID=80765 RepID=UPI0021591940|nr:uncharacterized protein LOC126555885 isoform X2 [Aphis gossypii]
MSNASENSTFQKTRLAVAKSGLYVVVVALVAVRFMDVMDVEGTHPHRPRPLTQRRSNLLFLGSSQLSKWLRLPNRKLQTRSIMGLNMFFGVMDGDVDGHQLCATITGHLALQESTALTIEIQEYSIIITYTHKLF